ncbi:MAG: Fic family protein [Gammaproteobacteria bacterium]|nr:Fic family protein [Gammaproteobacteria bacterium]MDE0248110.1 Fic family protein [Gammaproteobacteria bacterium]
MRDRQNPQRGPVQYHAGAFPPGADSFDWQVLLPHVGPAAAAVARYDGILQAMPNSGVLLSPLSTQEAVLSSRIEGTQATMAEVLEFEAGADAKSPERREDIHEILNYRRAMYKAEQMLETLPVSRRIICRAHEVLLDSVRGAGKSPGEYRRVPNWIGPPGRGIEEARFLPPTAAEIPDAMSRWERYANASAADVPDRLVQLAVLHAEFEALHPFLDGNGRVGRMLIPLMLWQWDMIERPHFYVSGFLEAHRSEYYDSLLSVSRDREWTTWTLFFMKAVRAQAEENLAKARGILGLYDELKTSIPQMTRSRYATPALDWLFRRPIFSSTNFVRGGDIPGPTARRFLTVLRTNGVLKVLVPSAGRRAALWVFPDLLNLAEGRKVF